MNARHTRDSRTRAATSFEARISEITDRPAPSSSSPGSWKSFTSVAGSALALASSADAAVIYSGPQNIAVEVPVPLPITTGTVANFATSAFIDVDGGGDDFALSARAQRIDAPPSDSAPDGIQGRMVSFGIDGFNNATVSGSTYAGVLVNSDFSALRLQPGDVIGCACTSASGGIAGHVDLQSGTQPPVLSEHGQFLPPSPDGTTTGFIGVVLGSGNYGWIQLRVERTDGIPFRVTALGWAYEDSGLPILAGSLVTTEVPEASTHLAALATGAAGVLAYRKRRRSTASPVA